MRVADTSALFALLMPTDAHHQRAVEDAASIGPVLVPAEILAELLALLRIRAGPAAARDAVGALRAQPNVEIQPSWDNPWDNILDAAWSEFEASANPSYVDAIVVAWCKKRKLQPWTYEDGVAAACA